MSVSQDMVFALATDERTLFVFASSQEAVAYCEGIDVEDGVWRFWDRHGRPLRARFSQPNRRRRFSVESGAYALVSDPEAERLAAVLHDIGQIDENPSFDSLAAVETYLATGARSV